MCTNMAYLYTARFVPEEAKREEGQFVFGNYRQTILLIYTDSMIIRLFGYWESIGNIFKVQNFVLEWCMRHLMMTLAKMVFTP